MKTFVVVLLILAAVSFADAVLCSCNLNTYDCNHATPPKSCSIEQGHMCVTHRKLLSDGTIRRRERCIDLSLNPTICVGGRNNEENMYECCDSGDMCNKYLPALLPHEIVNSSSVVPTPTPSVAVMVTPTPPAPAPLLCACSDPLTCPNTQTCQTDYKCFREEIFQNDGRHLQTRLGCLDKSNHVNFDEIDICSAVHDTPTSRLRCCDGQDYCNRDLVIEFPSPQPRDTPTPSRQATGTTSGGLKEDDLFFILSVVVVLVTMATVLVILLLLAIFCLRYHRDKAKVASLIHLQKSRKPSPTYVHASNVHSDRTPYSV